MVSVEDQEVWYLACLHVQLKCTIMHYAKKIFPSLYVLSTSKSLSAFANLLELARLAAVLICFVCGFSLSL